jgi:hypothetical protein
LRFQYGEINSNRMYGGCQDEEERMNHALYTKPHEEKIFLVLCACDLAVPLYPV